MLVEIRADDVTLDGLTLDGHNPALAGGVPLNGITAQIANGVGEEGGHPQRFAILNCLIRNFTSRGIFFKNDWMGLITLHSTNNISLGGVVMHNRLDNISAVAGTMPEMQQAPTGVGIYLYNNVFTEVLANTITRTAVGLWLANYHSGAGCVEIRGNALQVYLTGVGVNTFDGWSDARVDMVIAGNHIAVLDWARPAKVERYALYLLSIIGGDFLVCDNSITGGEVGVQVWDIDKISHLMLCNDTISGCQYGVVATNCHPVYNAAAYKDLHIVLNHEIIRDARQAGLLLDDDKAGNTPLEVTVTNGTTISGGKIGLLLRGARAHLTLLGSEPIRFAGQDTAYCELRDNGVSAPAELDLRAALFNGQHRTELSTGEAASVRTKLLDQRTEPRVGQIIF